MTFAAVSWGLGIVMTKVTLQQLAPLDVLGIELLVGTVVIWAVLFARRGPAAFAGWRAFAVLGLLEPALSFALGDFGLKMTGAADGALLLASESLFAVVLAHLVLSERMSPRVALAVGVGFAGSALIGLGGAGGGQTTLAGDLLVLGGAAAAAAYTVAARRVAQRGQPDVLSVTAIQLLTATVVCVPLLAIGAAGGHSHLAGADASHLAAAVATGLLSTAIPFLLYNVAIRDIEVAGAALISNLIPVIGAALAVLLLGEQLGSLQVLGGMAVIVAAFGAESGGDRADAPCAAFEAGT